MLAGDILKRYRHLTVEEAHELEMRVKANRTREEWKAQGAADADDYRRRSNFTASLEADQKAKIDAAKADPSGWQEYLADAANDLRANDLNHGATYTPEIRDDLSIEDAVREYMAAFGWSGLGSRQVAAAIKRDRRWVARALDAMVEAGEMTMGTFFVLSCLTAGVVGAGVLALVVCLEGCRRYTWKPLRAARREKLERQERCNHQWGEPVEVGQPHPLFRMDKAANGPRGSGDIRNSADAVIDVYDRGPGKFLLRLTKSRRCKTGAELFVELVDLDDGSLAIQAEPPFDPTSFIL